MTRSLIWIFAAALLTLAILWSMVPGASSSKSVERKALPQVPIASVVHIEPQVASPILETYGNVIPEFSATIAAETEGVVREIASAVHSGEQLDKGALVLRLDDSRQRRRLAAAEAAVEQARVTLIDEELRAEQASVDWARSGTKGKLPDYVARVPQLRAARSNINSAQAAVAEARWNLKRSEVRAPFNALVIRRLVSEGSYVQPGTSLIEIYSTDRAEVRLPLSERQWRLLPPEESVIDAAWPVQLESHDGSSQWEGRVTRIEQHLDENTRQRALIVTVDDPLSLDPPLLAGSFLRARFSGKTLEDVLEVPTSALTDRGEIWLITDEGVLEPLAVAAIGSREGSLLVEAPEARKSQRVVVKPMLSYVPGMTVEAIDGNPKDVQ